MVLKHAAKDESEEACIEQDVSSLHLRGPQKRPPYFRYGGAKRRVPAVTTPYFATYLIPAVPQDSSYIRSYFCMLKRQFNTSCFRLSTGYLALGPHRLPAARPGRPAILELHGRLDRRGMKKAAGGKTRQKLPDYCDVDTRHDANGQAVWPADSVAIDRARSFIAEWLGQAFAYNSARANLHSAASNQKTLIVPDKDADGLSAGVIMYRTLIALGLDKSHLDVHLIQKGSNIHHEDERAAMSLKKPGYVIVLDQGSRGGPPIVDSPATKCPPHRSSSQR